MSFEWPLNCSLINSFDPFHWPKCSRSRNYLYTKYTAIAFFAVLSINRAITRHTQQQQQFTNERTRQNTKTATPLISSKKIPISHTCATDHLYSTVFVLFCSTSREYESAEGIGTLIADIHFYFIDKKFASKIRYYLKSTQTVIYKYKQGTYGFK